MTFTASLCGKVFLSVFFLSGALADCDKVSHLFITAPTEMEALNGSCLHIPCNFTGEAFNYQTPIYAVWIKEDSDFSQKPGNVIFNSSVNNNKYPMKVIGDPRQKNCTTLFSSLITDYTNKYYFRVENSRYRATDICNHIQINVKDSAPSPEIHLSHLQLKEKESVTITCSALTPCPHSPPKLTWNLQQDAANNMEENRDRTFTTKIQQVITVSDQHDGYNISCSAAYPVDEGTGIKTAETNVTLSVSYAPKNTSVSISPSGLVEEGVCLNLTCSSRANPPVRNFTWFKTSTHGPIRVSGGDVYSFSLTDDTEGDYYCEAANDVGKQTSPVIHVNMKRDMRTFAKWGLAVGVVVVFILICFFVCICLTHRNPGQCQEDPTQIQTGKELVPQEAAGRTEDDIHYEDVSFHPRSPVRVQLNARQQETVYAQIKVSEWTRNTAQTTRGSEDLYAQVQRRQRQ